MYSRLNDIEFLESLVETGKSLGYMTNLLHCGDKFLLEKLKSYGLADPSLTVEDCKVPGWGTKIKKIYETFPYEEYVERIIKNKEKLYLIAEEYNFNYNTVKYVASKYKNRYREEQASTTV